MNLRQKKGQSVREHMMKMIAYLNKIEILGAEIDAETKNHMVLNILSDTFTQFKIDYELNKKDYTLAALMKDLHITENILKKKNSISLEANVAEGLSSSKPNVKEKGKNKKKKKGYGSTIPKKKDFKKSTASKGKCFHCNKDRHWKRNCKIFLNLKRKEKEIENNKQGKNNLLFIEACMTIVTIDTWIIDSGATYHVCNSMQGIRVTKRFRVKEATLRLRDGSRVEASAMRDITLNFNNSKYLVLKDCYYIPVFKRNLISVSRLIRQGYSIYFDNDIFVFKNKGLICTSYYTSNLFYFQSNILHCIMFKMMMRKLNLVIRKRK